MLAPFLCHTGTTCHSAWGRARSFSCLWSLTWKILVSSSSRKTHTPHRFYKLNLKDTQWLSRYHARHFHRCCKQHFSFFYAIFFSQGLAVEAVTNVLLVLAVASSDRASELPYMCLLKTELSLSIFLSYSSYMMIFSWLTERKNNQVDNNNYICLGLIGIAP